MKKCFTYETKQTADCVEWCPSQRDLVILGTYQLEKDSTRIGSLTSFQKKDEDLKEIKSIDNVGTLDIKWSWASPLLGQALSNGELSILNTNLDVVDSIDLNNKMCLSLDWNSRVDSKDESIVVSHYNGHLSIVKVTESKLTHDCSWKGHDYEAWIAAFNYHDKSQIFSGGDDSILCSWDIRSQKSIFKSREHEAGVCSIQSHPLKPHIFASGSYDERLCIWDLRKMKSPLKQKFVGGGVWRLKFNEKKEDLILLACMHKGFKIVDIKDEIEIKVHYENHTSLAYGVDWCLEDDQYIASCSFYDKSFQFWKYDIKGLS